ncbi:hypothetical protein A6A05_15355 [Magnetospirillum moscoviense]|uniref:Uncharacterized protein n=1 Tax=Magnetospirillum moscoviense TaxID=1437059 RepID=A0A178MI53_9PROT|nr:hypothetical protein A6A05_15355 [Magnetospirillum moscoviense]
MGQQRLQHSQYKSDVIPIRFRESDSEIAVLRQQLLGVQSKPCSDHVVWISNVFDHIVLPIPFNTTESLLVAAAKSNPSRRDMKLRRRQVTNGARPEL